MMPSMGTDETVMVEETMEMNDAPEGRTARRKRSTQLQSFDEVSHFGVKQRFDELSQFGWRNL